jgi:hypothetical protein
MEKPSLRSMLGYGVWLGSLAVGLVASYAIVYGWLDTTLEHFGTVYFGVLAISVALLLVIWLDYLLDTRILPD